MERHRIFSILATSFVFLVSILVWISEHDIPMSFKPYYHQSKAVVSDRRVYHDDVRSSENTSTVAPGSAHDIVESSDNSTEKQSTGRRKHTSDRKPGGCIVNILLFKKGKGMIGRKQGVYRCKDVDCSFRLSYSDDPKSLKGKHIVLLYFRTKLDWNALLTERPPGQIWIFYCRESPLHDHGGVPPPALLRATYNWTMTYRSDSTIGAPYGLYVTGDPEVPESDTRNWAAKKTKLIAWMASNCNLSGWPRGTFVKAFSRKHLHVDTYGKCGTLDCPKGQRCMNILSRYKFYFALENSLCKEYVTEKFWRNALSYGSVPIVLGASKEDYVSLAPPHSFIHLSDFASPAKLREYLVKLNNNDTLYNEYFQWKKQGRILQMPNGRLFLPETFCEMAQKYLEVRGKSPADLVTNQMPNLNRWWHNSCSKLDAPVVKQVLNGR